MNYRAKDHQLDTIQAKTAIIKHRKKSGAALTAPGKAKRSTAVAPRIHPPPGILCYSRKPAATDTFANKMPYIYVIETNSDFIFLKLPIENHVKKNDTHFSPTLTLSFKLSTEKDTKKQETTMSYSDNLFEKNLPHLSDKYKKPSKFPTHAAHFTEKVAPNPILAQNPAFSF